MQKINEFFLKDQNHVNNSNIEEDESDESKTVKRFDVILKDIKNIRRITKPICVKTWDSNINLHSLIIRLLNARKIVLEKDYRFDEAFQIFDEINIICH